MYEQKKKYVKMKERTTHWPSGNWSSFESIYADRVRTPFKKECQRIYLFEINIKSLTVPSDALAPTRVPRLFQQTSKIPPVPR